MRGNRQDEEVLSPREQTKFPESTDGESPSRYLIEGQRRRKRCRPRSALDQRGQTTQAVLSWLRSSARNDPASRTAGEAPAPDPQTDVLALTDDNPFLTHFCARGAKCRHPNARAVTRSGIRLRRFAQCSDEQHHGRCPGHVSCPSEASDWFDVRTARASRMGVALRIVSR